MKPARDARTKLIRTALGSLRRVSKTSALRRLRRRLGFSKAVARHKLRRVNAASIPLACEVCHEGPVTTLVADFIFACDSCARRIATAH